MNMGTSIDVREERGRVIAKYLRPHVREAVGGKWIVPSTSALSDGYVVDLEQRSCTCADHETRASKCKHMWAVEFIQKTIVQKVEASDGAEAVTTRKKRSTYPQNWPAYNRAQTEEKERVEILLRALCGGIEEPPYKGNGRPPLAMRDVVYGSVLKVYTTFSGRRAASDLRACEARGLFERKAPSYNSIARYLEKSELTPVLKGLVEESAAPLSALEIDFAPDATGLSTCTYRRWYDQKYGKEMTEQRWIKVHAMVGTITNIVVAADVTESTANDSPQFAPLLEATAKRFHIRDVMADKAYLSRKNISLVAEKGGTLYVPFKSNSRPGRGEWARLWHLYSYRRDEFLARYHQRSNVESTFSALKRKLGPSLRSKLLVAQYNEALCKVLAYNLSCLVHSIHELGIEPDWKKLGEL